MYYKNHAVSLCAYSWVTIAVRLSRKKTRKQPTAGITRDTGGTNDDQLTCSIIVSFAAF